MAIYYITGFFILLYAAYPFFIGLYARKNMLQNPEIKSIPGVSVVLLSFNGEPWLEEKIKFLFRELSGFNTSELIIIDDHSTDNSKSIIEKFSIHQTIRAIFKKQRKGIADSMNLGVSLAKYDYVIFCDQRQQICTGSLQRIVEPLRFKNVGAVSGCISHIDKANCDSLMRRHENYIKNSESSIGNLIGVYGPLYAFRKKYYQPVPGNIILDDLYLSLKILKSKQIVLIKDCGIIDEDFSVLYNYQRTRRYLAGLMQILFNKKIVHDLNNMQLLMLIWHKYLRLLLPVLLSLSYLVSGAMMNQSGLSLAIFMVMNLLGVLALLQMAFKFQSRIINVVRVNLYYVFATFELVYRLIPKYIFSQFYKTQEHSKSKKTAPDLSDQV